MCGFFVEASNDTSHRLTSFSEALENLYHRGPDASGIFKTEVEDTKVLLGHRRLSIIDLTDSANQPFISICQNYVLVFNGEIYNFKEIRVMLQELGYSFKTNSDTEVLLNAWINWGEKCLNKFIGMFSFLILDKEAKKINIAVDQFGIKPLYYIEHSNSIFFSSEISPFLHYIDKEFFINDQILCDYLLHGDYDYSENTFVDSIKRVMPAELIEVDLASCRVTKKHYYWRPSIEEQAIEYYDAKKRLTELLKRSLALHKISDVEISAALSGGIDSSSIVMLLDELTEFAELKTFSYISETDEINEEKWVDIVTAASKTKNIKVSFSASELKHDLSNFVKSLGEPVASLSTYAQYKIFESINKNNIKVSIDGQGADEIFAGYNGFIGYRLLSLFEEKRFYDMYKLLISWSSWPGRSAIYGFASFLSLLIPAYFTNFLSSFFSKTKGSKFINLDYFNKNGARIHRYIYATTNIWDRANRKRRLLEKLRFQTIMGGGLLPLLRHADRTSMRWSIESRVPFLNKEIVEFVFSLPEEFLLSPNGKTKNILRDAMEGIVPSPILNRKDKIGFAASERDLLKIFSKDINSVLKPLNNISFINTQAVKKEFHRMVSSNDYSYPHLWRIINFSVWLNEYPMLKFNKNN